MLCIVEVMEDFSESEHYIVEVMEEFIESNSGMWFFSLFLISHFYWQHPWAGFRDKLKGAMLPTHTCSKFVSVSNV